MSNGTSLVKTSNGTILQIAKTSAGYSVRFGGFMTPSSPHSPNIACNERHQPGAWSMSSANYDGMLNQCCRAAIA